MRIDYTARFEKTKQIITEECQKLFETLYKHSTLPTDFRITMSAVNKQTGGIAECEASILIPNPINYKTRCRLTGKIGDCQVSVVNDGEGHFRVTIDDKEYPRLPQNIVEKQLGIPVQKRKAGGSSETIGRAVWRHFANRYNLLNKTVAFCDIT